MRSAKQEAFVAATILAIWLVTVGGSTGVAQDTSGQLPAAVEGYTHQQSSASGGYAVGAIRDTPESLSADLGWTQRVARLVRGRTQLEGGYSLLRDSVDGDSVTQHAFPDLLLRFGLTDRLELRLGWPGYISSPLDDPTLGDRVSGTLDPNVGFAFDLYGQHGLLPQTAVLATVPVSLEGNPFALNSLQPLAELWYAWQTGEQTALSGRSGFAIFDVAGDDYTQFQQSLSFDVLVTDRLGVFVSWEMLANHGSWNDTGQHMAGGGLSFLLTERFAVSWRSAIGLNPVAPDFLNDIRFAYRF